MYINSFFLITDLVSSNKSNKSSLIYKTNWKQNKTPKKASYFIVRQILHRIRTYSMGILKRKKRSLMYDFFIKKQGVAFDYHLFHRTDVLCHCSITFPKFYQASIDYLYVLEEEPFRYFFTRVMSHLYKCDIEIVRYYIISQIQGTRKKRLANERMITKVLKDLGFIEQPGKHLNYYFR